RRRAPHGSRPPPRARARARRGTPRAPAPAAGPRARSRDGRPTVEGDDPAREQPVGDGAEPGRLEAPGELVRPREPEAASRQMRVRGPSGEHLPEERPNTTEPEPVERRQQPARARDLQDREPAPRTEHAPKLAEARIEVCDVPDAEPDCGRVEALRL